MVYQGTVHNGVVVFDNGIQLPEGTPVRVELITNKTVEIQQDATDDDLLNMADFAVDM
jgi:hypothetical protein